MKQNRLCQIGAGSCESDPLSGQLNGSDVLHEPRHIVHTSHVDLNAVSNACDGDVLLANILGSHGAEECGGDKE